MTRVGICGGLLLALGLTGCGMNNALVGDAGMIRDRSTDYRSAQSLPTLQVPAHLDAGRLRDTMSVPEVGQAAIRSEVEDDAPRPEVFYLEAGSDLVNLERDGARKVILVEEPVEVVWPKVQEFWDFNEVAVVLSSPAEGVMETDWITKEKGKQPGFFSSMIRRMTFQPIDGPTRDKLRLTLSPEGQGRTSIRLRHLRVADAQADQPLDWKQDAKDVSHQSEVMYDLLHFLSKASTPASARALRVQRAKQQQQGANPQFGRDSRGYPVLRLSSDVDQAWVQLEQALRQANIDVGSSDRELGKYYVSYTTMTPIEEKEAGFWGFIKWLHSDREAIKLNSGVIDAALGREGEKGEIRYSAKQDPASDPADLAQKEGYKIWLGDRVIYVFESSERQFERNEATGKMEFTERYQIKLNRRNSGVFVSVLTEAAAPAPTQVAEEILWALKEQLGAS